MEGHQGEPRGHGEPDLEPHLPRARPRHPREPLPSRQRRRAWPPCSGWSPSRGRTSAGSSGLGKIGRAELLFKRLEDKEIAELRDRFSGTQKERAAAERPPRERLSRPDPGGDRRSGSAATVDLRVAKIVDIRRHPDAEKLYIETVDLGDGAAHDRLGARAPLHGGGASRQEHRAGGEPEARAPAGSGEQGHAPGGADGEDRRGPVRRRCTAGRQGGRRRGTRRNGPRGRGGSRRDRHRHVFHHADHCRRLAGHGRRCAAPVRGVVRSSRRKSRRAG